MCCCCCWLESRSLILLLPLPPPLTPSPTFTRSRFPNRKPDPLPSSKQFTWCSDDDGDDDDYYDLVFVLPPHCLLKHVFLVFTPPQLGTPSSSSPTNTRNPTLQAPYTFSLARRRRRRIYRFHMCHVAERTNQGPAPNPTPHCAIWKAVLNFYDLNFSSCSSPASASIPPLRFSTADCAFRRKCTTSYF